MCNRVGRVGGLALTRVIRSEPFEMLPSYGGQVREGGSSQDTSHTITYTILDFKREFTTARNA